MAAKNAAAELAEKMVQTLRAQRDFGADAYPLSLDRLVALSDPTTPAAEQKKAVKHKNFTAHVVLAQKKNADSPVALAEDTQRLAESPLLLTYVLEKVCTPKTPALPIDTLAKKVDAPLHDAFRAALDQTVLDGNLPETVAGTTIKKKVCLYLKRMPPAPPPPAEALAAKILEQLRRSAPEDHGHTLSAEIKTIQPEATSKLIEETLKHKTFKPAVILAVKNNLDTPFALKENAQKLAESSGLVEFLVSLLRTESSQAIPLADLKKKVVKELQKPFEQSLAEKVKTRALPSGIGALRIKKVVHLFLLGDVLPPEGHAPRQERPTTIPTQASGPAFEEAFVYLDGRSGGHNLVSLVDLRRELVWDRTSFDAELARLRREGRFSLIGAEGRHGITEEEQEAGIPEDGRLLLYVARKF